MVPRWGLLPPLGRCMRSMASVDRVEWACLSRYPIGNLTGGSRGGDCGRGDAPEGATRCGAAVEDLRRRRCRLRDGLEAGAKERRQPAGRAELCASALLGGVRNGCWGLGGGLCCEGSGCVGARAGQRLRWLGVDRGRGRGCLVGVARVLRP
jgi:hypothetical protein